MTLTIIPSTSMIKNAGIIEIAAPVWYSRYDNGDLIEQYPYGLVYRCSSTRVALMDSFEVFFSFGSQDFYVLQITYYDLLGDPSEPLTITCPDWRNPIIPKLDEGYEVKIKDLQENVIEVSE